MGQSVNMLRGVIAGVIPSKDFLGCHARCHACCQENRKERKAARRLVTKWRRLVVISSTPVLSFELNKQYSSNGWMQRDGKHNCFLCFFFVVCLWVRVSIFEYSEKRYTKTICAPNWNFNAGHSIALDVHLGVMCPSLKIGAGVDKYLWHCGVLWALIEYWLYTFPMKTKARC